MQDRRLYYRDYTIKAILRDSQNTEKILQLENAVFIGTDHQTDTYFKVNKGKLKWREGEIENLITHYERIATADGEHTIVYRYDLNPSEQEISDLFNHFETAGMVRKERKIFFIGNVKIHLDTLASGERYIELEAIDRSGSKSIDELKAECVSVKLLLQIRDEDQVKTGYL